MIYFLHKDFRKVARELLDNDEIFKEVFEEVALTLSMAHRVLDGKETKKGRWKYYSLDERLEDRLLNSTKTDTDEIKWVCSGKEKYFWLYKFFLEMCREYKKRFNENFILEKKLGNALISYPKNLTRGDGFKFPNTIDFYQKAYEDRKKELEGEEQ